MSTIIQDIERRQLREVPRFKAGDTVRVHFRVIEGTRQRIQVFEGIVIKRQGAGARETFTVRKNSFGVGVERTFPLHSPKIDKIEVQADRRREPREALLPARQGRQEGSRPRAAPALSAASPLSSSSVGTPVACQVASHGRCCEPPSPPRLICLCCRLHRTWPGYGFQPRNFFANSGPRRSADRPRPGLSSAGWRASAPTGQKLLRYDRALGVRLVAGARTRRGEGRSPGRSSSPASCSTTSACASIACGRSRC